MHRYPIGGMGFLTSTSTKASIVESGEFSVWVRIEMRMGPPVFVCECYFPAKYEADKLKKAWDEGRRRWRNSGIWATSC